MGREPRPERLRLRVGIPIRYARMGYRNYVPGAGAGVLIKLKLLGSQCLARRSVSRGPHVQTARASTPH